MSQINYCTPIYHPNPNTWTQSIENAVEGYFDIGLEKKTAQVIDSNSVKLVDAQTPSYIATMLKVISYATLILPAVMLSAKSILRSIHSYHITNNRSLFPSDRDIDQKPDEMIDLKHNNFLNPSILQQLPTTILSYNEAYKEVIAKLKELRDKEDSKTILLNTMKNPMMKDGSYIYCYDQIGSSSDSFSLSQEEVNQTWLYRILNELKTIGSIENFERKSLGYNITFYSA